MVIICLANEARVIIICSWRANKIVWNSNKRISIVMRASFVFISEKDVRKVSFLWILNGIPELKLINRSRWNNNKQRTLKVKLWKVRMVSDINIRFNLLSLRKNITQSLICYGSQVLHFSHRNFLIERTCALEKRK